MADRPSRAAVRDALMVLRNLAPEHVAKAKAALRNPEATAKELSDARVWARSAFADMELRNLAFPNTQMRVVCAWCDAELDPAPGPEGAVSHGICPACYKREMAKLREPATA